MSLARFVVLALAAAMPVFADINEDYSPKDKDSAAQFSKGVAQARAQDYEGALKTFSALKGKDDPEVHNMLGYSLRKLGRLDEAFAEYAKALKLKPRFPEAREYLGEAHLQAALAELETLKGYGKDGEAARKDLAAALKAAAAKL